MRASGVLRRIREQPRSRLTAVAAGAVLAVSAPFGGLAPVPLDQRIPTVQPGEDVDVAPYSVKVERAVSVDEVPGVVKPLDAGNHLMVVLLEAENTTDTWVYASLLSPTSRERSWEWKNLVVLDEQVAPDGPAGVYSAVDDSHVRVMSPGVVYDLALVWEYAGAVPAELELGLATLHHDPLAISQDVKVWSHPTEAATITVPVEDRTPKGSSS